MARITNRTSTFSARAEGIAPGMDSSVDSSLGQMFLAEVGLEESGVARLIKSAYKLLNLEIAIAIIFLADLLS